MTPLTDHAWPGPGEHLWGPWMMHTPRQGSSPPTQYRTCCHPKCGASERRTAPAG